MNEDQIQYCERFMEFLLDLLSQLPTRRFFHAIFQESHALIRIQFSQILSLEQARLFSNQFEMVRFYDNFEINDLTGEPLFFDNITALHCEKIMELQVFFCFYFNILKSVNKSL